MVRAAGFDPASVGGSNPPSPAKKLLDKWNLMIIFYIWRVGEVGTHGTFDPTRIGSIPIRAKGELGLIIPKVNSTNRLVAIDNYYKNPNYCKFCGQMIKVRENEKPGDTRKKKFCNRSHAAKYNNRKRERTRIEDYFCDNCGEKKSKYAKLCEKCKKVFRFEKMMNSPMSRYFQNGNARIKYGRVREYARNTMEMYGIKKECFKCGYNFHAGVCHIKAISEFEETALMKEVNGLKNLIYLCPNHHWELDNRNLKI